MPLKLFIDEAKSRHAAFDGQAMLAVNRTPSREDAIAVAEFDKKAHHVNVVKDSLGFDLIGQARGQIERCRCEEGYGQT